MVRVHRVVTSVVDPGEGWNPNSHGSRQQRDQVWIDLQAVGIHLHSPISEAIDQSGCAAPGLLDLGRSFQAFRGESVHVASGVVKTCEGKLQVLASPPAWRVKADQSALLQASEAGLQRKRLIAS